MIFENWKPEKVFFTMALVIGLALTVLTPPMCTPDENAHFMNAYSISHFDVFPEVTKDGQVGRYVPRYVMDFLNTNHSKINRKGENRYTYDTIINDSLIGGQNGELVFYQSDLTKINPLCYLISAFGMAIGNLFGHFNKLIWQPYNLLLFGKLANLAFYISGIYYAIKNTAYMKRTMMVIALMPMSIFLGASVNYDAILITVSMLLFSTITKIIESKEEGHIGRKDIIIVLICAFFLIAVKQVCAPFLLILFAIPRRKFGSDKRYIKCIAYTLGSTILAYIPNLIIGYITRNQVTSDASYILAQKEYLYSNLLKFPGIIVHTISMYQQYYLTSFFGCLGNLDTNFPAPFILLFYCLLFVIVLFEISCIGKINWKIRVLPLLAEVIAISGMFYMLYTTWTCYPKIAGVGVDYISGVQGRYFIPMFLFCLLPFANGILCKWKDIKCIFETGVDNISRIVALCYGGLTVFIVYVRFW